MSENLVIVESPAKAKTIEKYLGPGYTVLASYGHVRDLVNKGLKGSGDYGVVTVGAFSGQGLNRSDQNGRLHWLARASYPFAAGKQIVELGVQGYTGKFVTTTQALTTRAPKGEEIAAGR